MKRFVIFLLTSFPRKRESILILSQMNKLDDQLRCWKPRFRGLCRQDTEANIRAANGCPAVINLNRNRDLNWC